MGRALDDHGVTLVRGAGQLRRPRPACGRCAARSTADVAAGGVRLVAGRRPAGMCAAGAVDCLQADATRCGGYTEWLRIAAVAAARHLRDVRPLRARAARAGRRAPCRTCATLEWFHDHVRIEHLLFDGAPDAAAGRWCRTSTRRGTASPSAPAAEQYRTG